MVATTNKNVRFSNNNQVSGLASANITFSSELTSFPFSYSQDNARFRVWKPAGNFTVDSTNKNIYINDGSNKTITLTEADYTYSTLATHIQTQLNASSSNWTVSYSTTTRKFTLANTGSVTLRETQTSNASWDMLGYTDGTDHAGTSFEADEARNHTHESVIYDLGSAKAIDFFACVGLVGETFTISDQATVTLKGNNVSSFTSPAVSKTPTRTDDGIFYFEDTDDMTYRYWEFKFIDRENTVGPEGFNLSHIYLGDYDTLTTTNIAPGISKSLIDLTTTQVSDAGSKFYRSRSKYWQFGNVGIQHLTESERLELQTFFQANGVGEPFYISIDPTLEVSSTINEYTKLVSFDNSPIFSHVIRNLYNVTFEISEVV
jgi:hypothetical protein